jgi:integrase/recombinase XerD
MKPKDMSNTTHSKLAALGAVRPAWVLAYRAFEVHLAIDKNLSAHSIEAYLRDVVRLTQFLELQTWQIAPTAVGRVEMEAYTLWLGGMGLEPSSQSRMLSGVRAFFKHLLMDDQINEDPTAFLDRPRLGRYLPDVLSIEEVNALLLSIDVSEPLGVRNRAMLETLYACGLRVSELIGLRLEDYFPEEGMVRVIGKNNKQRIVPIGEEAIKQINYYLLYVRAEQNIKQGHEHIIFLNRRGAKLTRVMVFYIIKDCAVRAGVLKSVSPHTFRHSFATHLIEGGADLKAIQDMLGHESITTTEIYTHLDTDYLRETIQLFHPRVKHTR